MTTLNSKSRKVTRVGKKTGKDAFRCWIKEGDNESSYGFGTKVKQGRKTDKNVTFENESHETKTTIVNK